MDETAPDVEGTHATVDPRAVEKAPTQFVGFRVWLGLGALLVAVGILLASVGFTYWVMPTAMGRPPIPQKALWATLGIGSLLALCGAYLAYRTVVPFLKVHNPDAEPEPKRSELLYGMHLVGLGAALLTVALLNHVVMAGFAWSLGREPVLAGSSTPLLQSGAPLANPAPSPESTPERPEDDTPFRRDLFQLFGKTQGEAVLVVMLLVVSSSVAVLGALFYFSTSLWSKLRSPDRERFDYSIFWAGLGFRLGEAVLFNLVLFLVMRKYAKDQALLLPIGSLFVGMFLKSGEQLISGMAQRLLAAMKVLIPATIVAESEAPLEEFDRIVTELPKDVGPRTDALKKLAAALARLQGVKRPVRGDESTGRIVALFDGDRVTEERLAQEIRLLGYDSQSRGSGS